MIRSKTVFVVGAGASHELGFPLGEGLLSSIGRALNYDRDPFGQAVGANQRIWQELQSAAQQRGKQTAPFLEAAWRVRDAAHLGLSIDNVIHQQNDDEQFVLVAKLAIASEILEAEAKSDLRVHDNYRTVTWPKVRGTWLGGFAQLLVQDVERQSLESIFDNVCVISFNYDRSIKRFFPLALQSQFAIPSAEADALCNRLRILHPYGSLGNLPGEIGVTVQFGDQRNSLAPVAANIRTFTEQIEDDDSQQEMKAALIQADRIVFLGFGYLAQNMALLSRGESGSASQVLGTSYGLSEPDVELVQNELGYFFPPDHRGFKAAKLSPLKCAPFIRENFRTLTS